MATTELRHRPNTTPATATDPKWRNSGKKMAMARRGLKSLAIAISFPLALTTIVLLFTTSSSSFSHHTQTISRPFWNLPGWAFHLATVSCSSLMGLSSWLAWAEGGFHRRPEALPLYVAQLVFGLAWGPLLFCKDSPRAALVAAVGLVAALVGCVRCFRRVNPIAAELVKPCLAWAAFLALFSYMLV